jgi:hypothetical protein
MLCFTTESNLLIRSSFKFSVLISYICFLSFYFDQDKEV